MSAKPVLNAFSIDVEDYFQVAALAPAAPPESWPKWEYRVERNTEVHSRALRRAEHQGHVFHPGVVRGALAGAHPEDRRGGPRDRLPRVFAPAHL